MRTTLLVLTFLGLTLAQNTEQRPSPIAAATPFSPIQSVTRPAVTTTPAVGRTAPNTAFSPTRSIPNGYRHQHHRPGHWQGRLKEQREKARKRASIIFGSLMGGLVTLFIIGTGLMCIRRRRIVKSRLARQLEERIGVQTSPVDSRYGERFDSIEKLPALGDEHPSAESPAKRPSKFSTFLSFFKGRGGKSQPTIAEKETSADLDLESATLYPAYGSNASLVNQGKQASVAQLDARLDLPELKRTTSA